MVYSELVKSEDWNLRAQMGQRSRQVRNRSILETDRRQMDSDRPEIRVDPIPNSSIAI